MQLICDHAGRILGTTAGFPVSWNDKTIVRYDANVHQVMHDKLYTDRSYNVYTRVADGTDSYRQMCGLYLISDGGYHLWAELMCPWKYSSVPAVYNTLN